MLSNLRLVLPKRRSAPVFDPSEDEKCPDVHRGPRAQDVYSPPIDEARSN